MKQLIQIGYEKKEWKLIPTVWCIIIYFQFRKIFLETWTKKTNGQMKIMEGKSKFVKKW